MSLPHFRRAGVAGAGPQGSPGPRSPELRVAPPPATRRLQLRSAVFAALMIVFSLLCWGASLFIPRTGQGAPDLVVQGNVLASTGGLLKFLREDPRLMWGGLVTSWFWLVGAVALSLMPLLVKNVLGGDEDVVTACLAVFSISVAIGSGLAAWLAAGRIVLLPTVIAAVLLGLFAMDLGWSTAGVDPISGFSGYLALFGSWRGIRLAVDLAGLAIAGGLFIVPVFAAVQAWAGADRRARVVAAVNVLNAAFMAGSALVVMLLQSAGLTTSNLFMLLGACSLVVAVVIVQVAVFPHLRLFGVVPDLGLLLAVAVGYEEGPEEGALVGFAAGFGFDLFLETPVGLNALVYGLVGYGAGILESGLFRSPRWLPSRLGLLGGLAGGLLFIGIGVLVGIEVVKGMRCHAQ